MAFSLSFDRLLGISQKFVQVGSITTGNVKLQVGRASTVVEVTSGTEQVNTEQATVQGVLTVPQIALFNVFNFHNYDPGGNVLSGVLGGGIGQVNGTTAHNQPGCDPVTNPTLCTGRTNLITPGAASGVNWYAVPRQAEFGAKVTF
ncbi:MAG: hypothetical protein ACYDDI_00705 [Candidatus Acidiferrales bacterium]